jgi:hypothetical protein
MRREGAKQFSETIVNCAYQFLFCAKIALGRLNRGVPQQELDLLQIATGAAA